MNNYFFSCKRRNSFLFSFFLILAISPSQSISQSTWVFFKDKGPDAEYLLSRPDIYLSQRALENRNQRRLSVDLYDVPVYESYVQQLRNKGYEVLSTSHWLNAAAVKGDINPEKLKTEFSFVSSGKRVLTYEFNGIPEPKLNIKTVDPSLYKTQNSVINYGAAGWQNDMLNISCLHDKGFTGRGVLMTICDAGFAGIDTIHVFDSLWLQNRIIHIRDFVDNDTMVFDADVHGCMVLSTIAGNTPGILVGTAPDVSLLLARTEQASSETHQEEYNWVNAMEWADSIGTQLIHSSLGYSMMDSGTVSYTYPEMDGNTTVITIAADIAASRGILVVNSAGNEGTSGWHYITSPCDGDSVLCVGAVDSFRVKADFSSFGPSADGRVKPDVMAMGRDASVVWPFSPFPITGSGTSFSGPIMAGFTVCLIQAHPQRTNMEIIHAIQQSADMFLTPDTSYGYGIPDACKADSILHIIDSTISAGVQRPQLDKGFIFYPNPAKNIVTLHRQQNFEANVSLLDLAGRVIIPSAKWSRGDWEIKLEVDELPAGVYLLKLERETGIFVERLMKR